AVGSPPGGRELPAPPRCLVPRHGAGIAQSRPRRQPPVARRPALSPRSRLRATPALDRGAAPAERSCAPAEMGRGVCRLSPLRRGAWYRVTRLTSNEAFVDVNHNGVSVPRSSLQILSRPYQHWTVVPRPRNAGRLPASWGARYVVCPNCCERAPLGRPAATM